MIVLTNEESKILKHSVKYKQDKIAVKISHKKQTVLTQGMTTSIKPRWSDKRTLTNIDLINSQ